MPSLLIGNLRAICGIYSGEFAGLMMADNAGSAALPAVTLKHALFHISG